MAVLAAQSPIGSALSLDTREGVAPVQFCRTPHQAREHQLCSLSVHEYARLEN
jgi:hypothetical protein